MFVSKQLGFPQVYLGPERFKKFREACRNNFHLISCNMDSVLTSYDQKTKKVNEYQISEYDNLSEKPIKNPHKPIIELVNICKIPPKHNNSPASVPSPVFC